MPSPEALEYQRWFAEQQGAPTVESLLGRLEQLRVELDEVEVRRSQLVAARTEAVAAARDAGATWAAVTAATGVTRLALRKEPGSVPPPAAHATAARSTKRGASNR